MNYRVTHITVLELFWYIQAQNVDSERMTDNYCGGVMSTTLLILSWLTKAYAVQNVSYYTTTKIVVWIKQNLVQMGYAVFLKLLL
jgi:hypothetical protein